MGFPNVTAFPIKALPSINVEDPTSNVTLAWSTFHNLTELILPFDCPAGELMTT